MSQSPFHRCVDIIQRMRFISGQRDCAVIFLLAKKMSLKSFLISLFYFITETQLQGELKACLAAPNAAKLLGTATFRADFNILV